MLTRPARLRILQTAAQRILEIGRPSVLAQEVTEGFVRQFLKGHHAVTRKQIEGVPGLQIELHAFPTRSPINSGPS